MLGEKADEEVLAALFTKLRLPETKEDIKPIVAELLEAGADGRIVAYYREKLGEWVAACDLHPLQKSVLEKEIAKLLQFAAEKADGDRQRDGGDEKERPDESPGSLEAD